MFDYKAYRKKNREKINKSKRDWRKKNLARSKLQAAGYARKYRALHPGRFKVYDSQNHAKQRARFKETLHQLRIEAGGKCSKCGYNEVIDILHFHHLGDKTIEVTRCKTLEQARMESKKCILLCPNCHAITHFIK